MSACERIREDLVAWLDGELDAAARAEVEAHVAACEACRRERTLLQATGGLLAGLEAPPPPEGFAARVRERIARDRVIRPAVRAWKRWLAPLAVAAALLAAVTGVAYRQGFLSPETTEPSQVASVEREVIAALDVIENLELLENLDLLEVYDAPDDPMQDLEEEKG